MELTDKAALTRWATAGGRPASVHRKHVSDGRGDVMRLEYGKSIWWQEFQNCGTPAGPLILIFPTCTGVFWRHSLLVNSGQTILKTGHHGVSPTHPQLPTLGNSPENSSAASPCFGERITIVLGYSYLASYPKPFL